MQTLPPSSPCPPTLVYLEDTRATAFGLTDPYNLRPINFTGLELHTGIVLRVVSRTRVGAPQ